EVAEPANFAAFWTQTLTDARDAAPGPATYDPVTDSGLRTVEVWDVRLPGWRGQPVAAWLLLRGARRRLPAAVAYLACGSRPRRPHHRRRHRGRRPPRRGGGRRPPPRPGGAPRRRPAAAPRRARPAARRGHLPGVRQRPGPSPGLAAVERRRLRPPGGRQPG